MVAEWCDHKLIVLLTGIQVFSLYTDVGNCANPCIIEKNTST